MAIREMLKKAGRGLAAVAVLAAGISVAAPQPAQAGISNGAAVALGLGSLALGAGLAARPYGYAPYGAYYYPPAPAYYYPPAPVYYPRSCWDPYYRRYYAC